MKRIPGFSWAHDSLNALNPHELQDRGIQVYFAPNIEHGVKLVNLEDGSVLSLKEKEHPPKEGYFAGYDSLQQWCNEKHHPFTETNGIVTVGLTDKHLESIG